MANTRGYRQVRAQLGVLSLGLRADVEDIAAQSAETVRSRVVVDINTQKPNPNYRVPEGATGRRAHIPSPPGGPPNADTGRLSTSYTTDTTSGRDNVRSRVVAGVVYAYWLEFGTRKMLPRPHLVPRFREEGPKFRQRLADALRARTRATNRRGST